MLTIDEELCTIIERLNLHPEFNHMTYVGKKYSKADLVDDLKQILDKTRENDA